MDYVNNVRIEDLYTVHILYSLGINLSSKHFSDEVFDENLV